MRRQKFRAFFFRVCLCRRFKRVYKVHPKVNLNSTINFSVSFDIAQDREEAAFMKQIYLSRQSTTGIQHIAELRQCRSFPANSVYYTSLLSRHNDLIPDNLKANNYYDIGGVLILRNHLRRTEIPEKSPPPRRRSL